MPSKKNGQKDGHVSWKDSLIKFTDNAKKQGLGDKPIL
jgi:hypothetical protein